jgi:hypothetical protein
VSNLFAEGMEEMGDLQTLALRKITPLKKYANLV